MTKIALQTAINVDGYDYEVQYRSSGAARMRYMLLHGSEVVYASTVLLQKEETDSWLTDDVLIQKIAALHPGIDFTPVNPAQ
ncbi:hypothetical protein [Sediminibacterium ginsengisoli]|uniref:Uncharacterized protein n=1 Tax=Sediminibacterium ginsengisoli TaxID=413434 RepID=A0A1T4RYM5_9BACT|nr:hypothetical protein [Sediminibacterium ginsengisoli]SKA20798.1 hypothetical protein SAMN04488132_11633 [Sediminibacterium ginsengisoli]